MKKKMKVSSLMIQNLTLLKKCKRKLRATEEASINGQIKFTLGFLLISAIKIQYK